MIQFTFLHLSPVPPIILSSSPQQDVPINSSQPIMISCNVSGYPLTGVQWWKGVSMVTPDGVHTMISTVKLQYGMSYNFTFEDIPTPALEEFELFTELTISPPFVREDTANYRCVVNSNFVEDPSVMADIPVFIQGMDIHIS